MFTKYDRQLRLWATSGQEAIESAHVCLVNANAVGTEIAKNLVLPNIGKLTIIDSAHVSQEDLMNNFFVQEEDIGKPRAQVTAHFLSELNPSVEIVAQCEIPELSAFNMFSLVICANVNDSEWIEALSRQIFPENIPLIVADSVGFYGTVHLSIKEHTIIEAHPHTLVDLRLDSVWPKLREFVDSFDFSKLTSVEQGHVPYVVLLLKLYPQFLQWVNTPEGTRASSHVKGEQQKFKLFIDRSRCTGDSENYDEARANVWRMFAKSTVPRCVLDITESESLTSKESAFWVLVSALKRYIRKHGCLPQPGILPDMKSDTKSYVELQKIYRDKAHEDCAEIAEFVKEDAPYSQIESSFIELFCKNAKCIQVLNGKPYSAKISDKSDEKYRVLFAAIMEYKRLVLHNGQGLVRPDDIAQEFTEEFKRYLQELIRASGELQNISAMIGGIGAQEAIKLITHQYVPTNNTVLFDGIASQTEAFRV